MSVGSCSRYALPGLPTEHANRDHESDEAPGGDGGEVAGGRFEPLTCDERRPDEVEEVGEGKHVRDGLQEGGHLPRGEEGAGDEGHRQVDRVDDRGRSLRGANERRDRHAQGGEGGRAERNRRREGGRRFGPRCIEEVASDQELRDRLEPDHDHHRGDDGPEVGPGAERRPAHALQEPRLAPDHERDRQARESRRSQAVAEEARDEVGGRVHTLDRVVAVHGAEQDEEDDREEEAEERGLAVPPEEELLRAKLVQEEPHSPSSRVNSRYTSSSVRRCTSRPSSSTPSASACPVSSCRTRVGSSVSITTSSPFLRKRISTAAWAARRSRGEPVPTIWPPARIATRSARRCASSM